MITNPALKIVGACDVFEQNNIFNFTRFPGFSEKISAISFVCKRNANSTDWQDVMRIAANAVLKSTGEWPLPAVQMYFFGASDTWMVSSAVNEHQKFWGKNPNLRQAIQETSSQIKFTSNSKVRFASIASFKSQDLGAFAEWNRKNQSGFLVLKSREWSFTDENVRIWYDLAFPEDSTRIDWSRLISGIIGTDDILVRSSGSFDDPDGAIDLFFDPRFNKSILK